MGGMKAEGNAEPLNLALETAAFLMTSPALLMRPAWPVAGG
jgi:hypothetical protein